MNEVFVARRVSVCKLRNVFYSVWDLMYGFVYEMRGTVDALWVYLQEMRNAVGTLWVCVCALIYCWCSVGTCVHTGDIVDSVWVYVFEMRDAIGAMRVNVF